MGVGVLGRMGAEAKQLGEILRGIEGLLDFSLVARRL
jgi:hypothetical protein